MEIEHLAFIMDGNRRYGKKQLISLDEAYKKGMEKFLEMVSLQVKYGIKETSFYGLSHDNYEKRPLKELKILFKLIKFFSSNEQIQDFFNEYNIKTNIIGDLKALDRTKKGREFGDKKMLKDALKEIEDRNSKIDKVKFVVNIAINYDGQTEIVSALKKISKKITSGEIKENNINEKMIKEHIWFSESKPADVIVRTGNSPRLSGFMLWDCEYSEIYLSNKLWPEFSEVDFINVMTWYKDQKRNFGK